MTIVCQKCGVRGFEELLVFCNKCQTSVEHRYCLDKTPKLKEQEVHWLCEQCCTRVPKVDTVDSINIRKRKKWATRHHRHRSSHADLLQRIKYRHLQNTFIAKTSPNMEKPLNGASHCSEKDVLKVATMSKESKSINIKQGDLLLSSEKNGVHPERENCERLGNEIEGRKMKTKRKLILDDDSDEDAPSLMPVDNFSDGVPCRSTAQLNKTFTHLPSPQNYGSSTAQPDKSMTESAAECYSHFPVSPIVHPVWRGFFNICDGKYGPVVAHLSNRACENVCNAADMLPQVLHFERLPRLEAWPKSFKCSMPTDDNIALYFFPGDVRAKAVLEQLLDDVIEKDQALKVIVGKAELLVFPSMLLPQRSHLFKGENYLWGVFKARQASRLPTTPDIHCPRSSEATGAVDEHQHLNIFKDAPTNHFSNFSGEVDGNEDDNAFRELGAPSGQVPDALRGSRGPGCQVPDEHLSRLNKVMEEPVGENKDALLRREASRPCLPPDESSGFVEVMDEQVMKNFDSNVEFNFRGEYEGDVDGSLAACLELFPLEVEDLGIAAKVRGSDEVDLELGLETVKDRKYECKPAVKEHMVLLFGRAIY